MSKGTTPRAIRISDDLWQAAKVAADERGDSISAIVRRALETYVTTPAEK